MDVMALAAHAAATVAACCRLVACVLPYRTAITAVPRCRRTPACIADAWMFAPSPLCRAAAHTCLAGPLMIVPSSRMQPRAPCIPSLLLALRMLLLCCRIHPRSRTTTGALTRSRPPRQVFLCSICAPWSSCCCAARASPACGHPAKGPGEIQTPSVSINRQRPRNQRDPPSANEILFPWCADPAP